MPAQAGKTKRKVFAIVRDKQGRPVVDLSAFGGTYKNLPFEISKALTQEDKDYLQKLEEI